ncbi:MAG: hypothetical protein K6G12_06310 [Lachnospiraceae bacterium]|nr:hypothetical protein [Lachnospiraceae bacterium]
MRKKNLASQKVIKAITIGLSAFMALSQPMAIFAEGDTNQDVSQSDSQQKVDQTAATPSTATVTSGNAVTATVEADEAVKAAMGGNYEETAQTQPEVSMVETLDGVVPVTPPVSQDTVATPDTAKPDPSAVKDATDSKIEKIDKKLTDADLALEGKDATEGNTEIEGIKDQVEDLYKLNADADKAVKNYEDKLDNVEGTNITLTGSLAYTAATAATTAEGAASAAVTNMNTAKTDADKVESMASATYVGQAAAIQAQNEAAKIAGDAKDKADAAKAEQAKAEQAVTDAQGAVDEATQKVEAAQKAFDDATGKVEAAQNKFDELIKAYGLENVLLDEKGNLILDDNGNPKGIGDGLVKAAISASWDALQLAKGDQSEAKTGLETAKSEQSKAADAVTKAEKALEDAEKLAQDNQAAYAKAAKDLERANLIVEVNESEKKKSDAYKDYINFYYIPYLNVVASSNLSSANDELAQKLIKFKLYEEGIDTNDIRFGNEGSNITVTYGPDDALVTRRFTYASYYGWLDVSEIKQTKVGNKEVIIRSYYTDKSGTEVTIPENAKLKEDKESQPQNDYYYKSEISIKQPVSERTILVDAYYNGRKLKKENYKYVEKDQYGYYIPDQWGFGKNYLYNVETRTEYYYTDDNGEEHIVKDNKLDRVTEYYYVDSYIDNSTGQTKTKICVVNKDDTLVDPIFGHRTIIVNGQPKDVLERPAYYTNIKQERKVVVYLHNVTEQIPIYTDTYTSLCKEWDYYKANKDITADTVNNKEKKLYDDLNAIVNYNKTELQNASDNAKQKKAEADQKVANATAALDVLTAKNEKVQKAYDKVMEAINALKAMQKIAGVSEEALQNMKNNLAAAETSLEKAQEEAGKAEEAATAAVKEADRAAEAAKATFKFVTPATPSTGEDIQTEVSGDINAGGSTSTTPSVTPSTVPTRVAGSVPEGTGALLTPNVEAGVAGARTGRNAGAGRAVAANGNGNVRIGDDQVALAGDLEEAKADVAEEAVAESTDNKPATAIIEEGEIPAAQSIEEGALTWWIWLLVVMAAAAGLGVYKYTDNKKKNQNQPTE